MVIRTPKLPHANLLARLRAIQNPPTIQRAKGYMKAAPKLGNIKPNMKAMRAPHR